MVDSEDLGKMGVTETQIVELLVFLPNVNDLFIRLQLVIGLNCLCVTFMSDGFEVSWNLLHFYSLHLNSAHNVIIDTVVQNSDSSVFLKIVLD